MMEMSVKIKKIREGAKIPVYGSEGAAACDVFACIEKDVVVKAGETVKITTGIAMALPEGTGMFVLPRSGLATNQGLRPANTPGLCDSDYRGEYIVSLHNDSREDSIIHNGDRIAQLMLLPYYKALFKEVAELDKTERGEGGFGSTGMK